MKYKKGDIVIVKFPFVLKDHGEKQKGRPALVISDDTIEKRYQDVVLAAITSQIPSDIKKLEIILEPTKTCGLVKRSLLRLDFIMTVPEELIARKIGEISKALTIEVDRRLKNLFGIDVA
ncbi:MAG: type II toxin-antitoxin system PemK/MazF family toxin [Planctomycetes bacterium]|nr:type II toxin-antitoxin system PemK/MazF family toxin [Planctomycetota bacterium]